MADEIIPAPEVTPAPAPAEIEEQIDDADEVLEALHAEGIVDERRHGELMEVIRECREQLRQLTSREQTESPMLLTLQTQVSELQSRMEAALTEIRARLETPTVDSGAPQEPKPSNPQPSESATTTERNEPRTERSTDEPEHTEPPPPPPESARKKRVLKI